MIDEATQVYWQKFLTSLSPDSPLRDRPYVAECWGDTPALADALGALIVAGIKTSCCSSLWEWEAGDELRPEVGYLTIALDGSGNPLCVVETFEITLCNYDQVDAQFAFDEGEGDRSLAYWREAHWEYFSRVLEKFGLRPKMDMPLVCERFRVVYRE